MAPEGWRKLEAHLPAHRWSSCSRFWAVAVALGGLRAAVLRSSFMSDVRSNHCDVRHLLRIRQLRDATPSTTCFDESRSM